jgi:DNA invertase Pin-like site-specific DNA recombinase
MPSTTVGYARTSTRDQAAGLEAQLRDLKAAGAGKIFHEQLSSVDDNRSELTKALEYVREGDILVVTMLDRLARSVADMLRITQELERKGVTLKILGMNLDTSTPTGKLLLNLVGAVAQFEREIMLERQRDGIAKAKADGKYKGRAPTAMKQKDKVLELRAAGRTVDQITKELSIGRSSVFRILKPEA